MEVTFEYLELGDGARRAPWLLARDRSFPSKGWALLRRSRKGLRISEPFERVHPLVWLMAALGLVAVVGGGGARPPGANAPEPAA